MVSITGNLEIGRICIEGQNFLTVKADKDGGPLLYESDGGTAEVHFCRPGEDLEGKVSDIDEDRGKVKVMVSMFGRETPVELDFLQVRKL